MLILVMFAALASGHIVLKTPKPYKFPAYGPSNPIEPTGSDWPCKIPSGAGKLEIDGSPTSMAVGQPQTLSFERGNGAVHGGGSCQVSLLPGFEPSKTNADFRVIKSIEGGCPAMNMEGNLEAGQNPNTYNFTIPSSVPAGDYTLSWTWQQRIGGSPEFYQNCAPITVTGGERSSTDSLKSLPPVFMANIGEASKGCALNAAWKARQAVSYPDPGSDVDRPEGTDKLIKADCDGNPNASSGSGSGSSPSAPEASGDAPVVSSKPTSSATQKPSSSSMKPQPSTMKTSVKPAPSSSAVKSSVSAAPSINPSSAPNSTLAAPLPTQSSSDGQCTEGYLRCNDDQVSFSTCTGGIFRGPIPLASGTKCKLGVGQGLDLVNPV